MSKYRILDLFCGAGGAAVGYYRAGFEVVGVDINPQPHYPFEFYQGDALTYPTKDFDAIHASPPCQAYSSLRFIGKQEHKEHPALIVPVREMLQASGLSFVIENVQGAPLISPIVLCGQFFGLGVRRHRLFEVSFPLAQPNCKPFHKPRPIAVYGDHPQNSKNSSINRAHTLKDGQDAMGIDWMPWKTLTQSIPPAYTEYIGKQLLAYLRNLDLVGRRSLVYGE